jgi:hypothetical protein
MRRPRAACPCLGRYPRPVLIKAYLKGWEAALLALADLFGEGDPAIAADDEGDYYLSFTVPDEFFHDAERLQATASVLLRRLNGLGRVFDHEFLPVGLVGRFSDETGQQQQVVLADSAEGRGYAFAAVAVTEGEQPPVPTPPSPGPGYLQLAEVDPDAAEVLAILSKPDSLPDWFDLYKVLEIVSQNVSGLPGLKGLPRLKKAGWVPAAQLEAFTASANHQGISGGQARHARMRGTPSPRLMMTLTEAQQLISALVKAWLDWRRSSSGP